MLRFAVHIRSQLQILASIGAALLLSACRIGGDVTNSPAQIIQAPILAAPTIALPTASPVYTSGSSLTIGGLCQDGDSIRLRGNGLTQTVTCTATAYTFTVSAVVDGVYAYIIDQTDSNGNLSSAVSQVWIRASSIPIPTLTAPLSNPFSSGQNSLHLAGSCSTGATVTLANAYTASTACTNAQFAFTVPMTIDGDYDFTIAQTDPAGNTASILFHWHKQALTISPSAPTLPVVTLQNLTVTGGSGVYTLTVPNNLSGGVLDGTLKTYTTGTLAGVTDTILVTDSLGTTASAAFTTVVGPVDHLVLVDGDAQTALIGSKLTKALSVKVVDRYGNGIANKKVSFQPDKGDARIIGNPVQTTDATGLAKVFARLGYSNVNSTVVVSSATTPYPDLAGSGHSTLTFNESATVNAGGYALFGLNFSSVPQPGEMLLANFGAAHHDNIHRDVAVVNAGGTSVGILLNRGNGVYSSEVYSVCAGPTALASGDFNGDGLIDLAVACSSGYVTILLGNLDGTFTRGATFVTDPGPVSIVAGDFRKIGKTDLILASSVMNELCVHTSNGDGTFGAATAIAGMTGLSPIAIRTADMNKDGALDLVVLNGNGTNTVSVILNKNNHAIAFNSNVDYQTGVAASGLSIGDFDSDTFSDVVVSNANDNDVGIFLNNGSGGLTAMQTVSVGNSPAAVVAGDFHGSGYANDIAVVNTGDNTVGILVNATPTGMAVLDFGTMNPIPMVSAPASLAVGDSNGDGFNDIFSALNSTPAAINVLLGNGTGAFTDHFNVGNNPVALAYGNFINSDANPDVVVVNQTSATAVILKSLGNGRFSQFATLNTGSAPVAAVVNDFNGDGNLDVAVLSKGGKFVSVFMGDGTGNFSTRVDYSVGNTPLAIVTGDFNGDGMPDLAVANSTDNTISILINQGNGTFAASLTKLTTGTTPDGLVAADLNNDGRLDLISANAADGTLSVFIGNGDGTFQPQANYTVGQNPTVLIAEDFNGDGQIDIAALNSGDATVSIFLGNGTGILNPKTTVTVGGYSELGMTAGDFYGQGRIDLIVTNGDNTFALLKSQGNGFFANPVTLKAADPTTAFGAVMTFDFNNDGITDLLFLDSIMGTIDFWTGQ